MWNKTTDTSKIGNYVYGLAIPVYGSKYIIKYVGQASSSDIDRCFQHEKEAQKYLASRKASNVKKVEMINYFASNGDFEIVILAHQIPKDQLDTMENIYRQMADYGAMLFTINQDEIVFENNLTNIAATHNSKSDGNLGTGKMVVKPKTVKQIDDMYARKDFLESDEIAKKLDTQKRVLYVLNRPGIKTDGYIGWWAFGKKSLLSVEWLVFVGEGEFITHVFKKEDICFETRDGKLGFCARNLRNYINLLDKGNNMSPCFNNNGKKWIQKGFTYYPSR